jgi:hypothetical protein
MKPILIAAISIVNLALISYTIAMILQTRGKLMSRRVLAFLTAGVALDITSTICMIIASGKVITLHGVLGYTALGGMLIDMLLSYTHVKKSGINSPLSPSFTTWSLVAYFYWVLAYITGAILVGMR